ncbi:hypothetical protein BDV95DRAFT_612305 [Massariosphaeria phaeospora]|uniref:Uncharacterized protein n=1 Tax=Massariosphaeria phaeospora TaxID=100035 RepID=A0A7C8M2I4_9PLEO|nr:hypothetical protein BDV95DRAFT_612305 [Massariosphaeria phaeospora]
MHFSRISAIGATGLLFGQYAYAAPTSRLQPRGSILDSLPGGINTGTCAAVNSFDTPEVQKSIWEGGNAAELLDSYLNQNGVKKWANEIYKEMFPGSAASNMDCSSPEVTVHCDYGKVECSKFGDANASGMFYILESAKNIHTYFRLYYEQLETLKDEIDDDVHKVFEDFKTADAVKKPVGVASIVGASFGFASALTAAAPPLSGVLATGSALTGVVQAIMGEKEPVETGKDAEAAVKKQVRETLEQGREWVKTVHGAIFGEGAGEIPESMTFKSDKKYSHVITSVLDGGQWLQNQVGTEVLPAFDEARRNFKQMAAFQLLRTLNNAFVHINDNVGNEAACVDDKNAVWDGKRCITLYHRKDNGDLLGGLNGPGEILWQAEPVGYGMDRFATYQNTLDCWESNKGAMGSTNFDGFTSGLPKCAFGMEVKKGRFFELSGDSYGGKQLKLDTNYPNFPESEPKYEVWPKTDCFTFGLKCDIPSDEEIIAKFDGE